MPAPEASCTLRIKVPYPLTGLVSLCMKPVVVVMAELAGFNTVRVLEFRLSMALLMDNTPLPVPPTSILDCNVLVPPERFKFKKRVTELPEMFCTMAEGMTTEPTKVGVNRLVPLLLMKSSATVMVPILLMEELALF